MKTLDSILESVMGLKPEYEREALLEAKESLKELIRDVIGEAEEVKRITKPQAPIVVFAQQPFTSKLIMSNLKDYKYSWTWIKDNGTNFLNSHFQPLKVTEDICVFGELGSSFNQRGNLTYNPQFSQGNAYKQKSGKQKDNSAVVRGGKGGRADIHGFTTSSDGRRYPTNVLKFNRDSEKLHPTQKPLAILKYLIQTYTKEGDCILDPFAGSGTTLRAAKDLNRPCIVIEIDPRYIEIIKQRERQEVLL